MTDQLTIPPTTTVQVQIPNELAYYLMQQTVVCGQYLTKRSTGNSTHALAKYYGFYLLLKAEAPESGWIKNYTKQIPILSKNFNISQRTFFSYIKRLETLKLAFREGDDIRITGWEQLGRLLDIDTKQRTIIHFDYDGKQKIHWWFAAIEINANQERQAFMIWKKVNHNSDIREDLLAAMKKRGFDMTKRNDADYFSAQLFKLYVEDFKSGTEVHDILIHIRSDVNRGCNKLAEAWAMSKQLVSYWKKKMMEQKIIDVAKLRVVSEWTRETEACHKNKFCYIRWNEALKERVWYLCDQITLLMPWKWQGFLLQTEQKTPSILP